MIIWGSTGRDKRIAYGEFYCPACRGNASYSHQRVKRYFTLYFIPLFPLETLGEYVLCHRCNGQFDPAVLQLTAEQIQAAQQPWVCPSCGNNNPAEYDRCISCQTDRTADAEPISQ